jgi:hypothetical protein
MVGGTSIEKAQVGKFRATASPQKMTSATTDSLITTTAAARTQKGKV